MTKRFKRITIAPRSWGLRMFYLPFPFPFSLHFSPRSGPKFSWGIWGRCKLPQRGPGGALAAKASGYILSLRNMSSGNNCGFFVKTKSSIVSKKL